MTAPSQLGRFFDSEEHFCLLCADNAAVDRWLKSLATTCADVFLAVIDGSALRSEADIFCAFASAFRFPSYFGQNWDALNDCLCDLGWLDREKYLLVIRAADRIALPDKTLIDLLSDLRQTSQDWRTGDVAVTPETHVSRPFKTILQSRPESCDQTRRRFAILIPDVQFVQTDLISGQLSTR